MTRTPLRLVACIVTLALCACAGESTRRVAPPANGSTAHIGVLETTDIHSNILSYDYYKLAPIMSDMLHVCLITSFAAVWLIDNPSWWRTITGGMPSMAGGC